MTDVTIIEGGEAENEEQPNDEANDELVQPAQEEQPDEAEQPDESSHKVELARLEALVAAHLPDGTDIEAEKSYVNVKVNPDGSVETFYRPPTLGNSPKPSQESTKRPNPRKPPPKTQKSWEDKRSEIRAAKIKAGLIYE